MNALTGFVVVFLGGASVRRRHCVGKASLALLGPAFPYGTLVINVVGSFALGVDGGWFAMRGHASREWKLFLATGVIGGFTTCSTFSLETALHLEQRDVGLAFLYVGGTLSLGLIDVFDGLAPMHHALGA